MPSWSASLKRLLRLPNLGSVVLRVLIRPDPDPQRGHQSAVAMDTNVPGSATAYCKFHILHGEDWTKLDGMGEGLTQIARRSRGQALIWNFPLDITYKSTNAFGWPQLVVCVYGSDVFGRDVVKGYGCTHIPTCAGRYTLKIHLFRPQSATVLQSVAGWLTGMPAEFADYKFPSRSEGRDVTRVRGGGHVLVQLNIMTKARMAALNIGQDMELFGYNDGSQLAGGGSNNIKQL